MSNATHQSPKTAQPRWRLGWVAAAALVVGSAAMAATPSAGAWSAPYATRLAMQSEAAACANCGVVESVSEAKRGNLPSGLGALAGAVLAGLIAKEVGGKDGRTLATIIGLLGGMWAGNAAEKHYNGDTVYTVSVRMDDGSLRTIEQTSPIAAGARVTVDGNVLTQVTIPAVASARTMV